MGLSVCVRAGVYRLMHAVLFHIGHRNSLPFSASPQLPLQAVRKHVLKMPGIAIEWVNTRVFAGIKKKEKRLH